MFSERSHKRIVPMVRYTKPSSLDTAPFGKQWLFMSDGSSFQMYIQLSQDEKDPRWETMGFLLESAFDKMLSNQNFIDECLKVYQYQENNPVAKLLEMIKEQE